MYSTTLLAALAMASASPLSHGQMRTQAQTPTAQCAHMLLGAAPTTSANPQHVRKLCFESFFVSYNLSTKTPEYVAERITIASLMDASDETRTNRFYEEARLPSSWRAKLSDYATSGYDRGHMAPAADMPTPSAMAQSFSLANMVPQDPQNNRKIWASVEKATRKYAMRSGQALYVITGPAYLCKQDCKTIGEGVKVPTHLFKLIQTEGGKSYAYWSENKSGAQVQIISKQELSNRTSIHF